MYLHTLPDILKVVLQDLLLLCHYCPSWMGCLAILQDNKAYTNMYNHCVNLLMSLFKTVMHVMWFKGYTISLLYQLKFVNRSSLMYY